jgi:hypothetical protein
VPASSALVSSGHRQPNVTKAHDGNRRVVLICPQHGGAEAWRVHTPIIRRPVTVRPDFFIVGAPEVFIAMRPKEPQFFAADTLARFGMRYPDDLPHYLALFAAAGDAKRVGDASTSYLEAPEAPGRIREFNADSRIIVMLRDPVSMMRSLHSMQVTAGLERELDFRRALEDEKRRPGFGKVGDQSSVRYRDRVRFSEMLPGWFDAFGRERVHVMLLEDLAADTPEAFRGVLEFLRVDPAYAPPIFKRYNTREWPRSPLLARVNSHLPRHSVPHGTRERVLVPVAHFIRNVNRSRKPRATDVPAELRVSLQEELGPEVDRLSGLLGRDLRHAWWGEPSRT